MNRKASKVFDDHYDHLYGSRRDAFVLTKTHIALLRRMRLDWDGTETGAPMTDPRQPFGSTAPLNDIGQAFGTDDVEQQARHYLDMVFAMGEFLSNCSIAPGTYPLSRVSAEQLVRAMQGYGFDDPHKEIGLTADGDVLLNAEIITLLRNTPIDWGDEEVWPGPCIDPKRPYGDMTWYALDVARILDWPMDKDEEGYFRPSEAQETAARALHLRTLGALYAMLEHGQMATIGGPAGRN
jgi:hypothetical protein